MSRRRAKPGWAWAGTGSSPTPWQCFRSQDWGLLFFLFCFVFGLLWTPSETRSGPPDPPDRDLPGSGPPLPRRARLAPGIRCAVIARPGRAARGSPPGVCVMRAGPSRALRPRPSRARKEEGRQRLVSTVYTLFQTTGF